MARAKVAEPFSGLLFFTWFELQEQVNSMFAPMSFEDIALCVGKQFLHSAIAQRGCFCRQECGGCVFAREPANDKFVWADACRVSDVVLNCFQRRDYVLDDVFGIVFIHEISPS
jgi:hypothetical protein